jgi:hypothetical protein
MQNMKKYVLEFIGMSVFLAESSDGDQMTYGA